MIDKVKAHATLTNYIIREEYSDGDYSEVGPFDNSELAWEVFRGNCDAYTAAYGEQSKVTISARDTITGITRILATLTF